VTKKHLETTAAAKNNKQHSITYTEKMNKYVKTQEIEDIHLFEDKRR
jgi:hypothetical protein